jgi:hypothetical protein
VPRAAVPQRDDWRREQLHPDARRRDVHSGPPAARQPDDQRLAESQRVRLRGDPRRHPPPRAADCCRACLVPDRAAVAEQCSAPAGRQPRAEFAPAEAPVPVSRADRPADLAVRRGRLAAGPEDDSASPEWQLHPLRLQCLPARADEH